MVGTELNLKGKILFFYTSYHLPLLILIINNNSISNVNVMGHNLKFWLAVISIIIAIIAMFLIWNMKKETESFQIKKIQNITNESMSYVVTIIIGLCYQNLNIFSNYQIPHWKKVPFFDIGFILLVILLGAVYFGSKAYYMQPYFIFLNYGIYKCEIDGDREIVVISQEKPEKKPVNLSQIHGDVYLLR
ncbi:putative membrane protein [Methanococcus maripaludis]|uniref:Putative membrane protein n=1 Tax=Methanococcus maripaludis TaxID=39152 RepID=A0A7J9NN51_METMI|nr:hypothetical protein [Methanococcus maripaludis]MBA2846469.1 putative membrane protein [Methanococcus maripaludis]